MTVALLNTNTRGRGVASPLTVAMNSNTGGVDTCAFVDVEYDQATGMSITGVTFGGQAMSSCGPASHDTTKDSYVESFYLKNPPTGTGGGAPSLVITVSGTVTDIYCNLSVYQFVNQTTPVRAGTYQSVTGASGQVSTAGGQFSMTVSSNTVDRTYTAINSPSGNTGTNQTADAAPDTGGAYSGAVDHCTTSAASVTHTWSGLGATQPVSMIGFSINGDPNSAPSAGQPATPGPGRHPSRLNVAKAQTAGFVPGATPDPPFTVRSLGPTSRGGRYVGPGGRPRQWAYVASPSFAQNMAPPAGAVRALGQAPVLTPGVATISEPAAVLRVIGQAPTLTPGGVSITGVASTVRLLGAAPTFSNVNLVAVPASSVRLIGQAPTLSAGAVSIAEPASTVRLIGQIPVLSNAGTIAVPAGSIRLLGQAPTLTPGAASRVMPAAVVRLLGAVPGMTGGVQLVIVDDRRRRWVGGVRNR